MEPFGACDRSAPQGVAVLEREALAARSHRVVDAVLADVDHAGGWAEQTPPQETGRAARMRGGARRACYWQPNADRYSSAMIRR